VKNRNAKENFPSLVVFLAVNFRKCLKNRKVKERNVKASGTVLI